MTTISVVLRLALPALREGRLAGHAEIVSDGTRLVIRDADELIAAVRQHTDPPAAGDERPDAATDVAPPAA
ncbi:MAG: hypothetical protein U0869_23740 [Chloroflexota bacterium]